MTEYKNCSRCGETKEYSLFSRLASAKTGRAPACKECVKKAAELASDKNKEYKRKYYEKNKEVLSEAAKLYRKENKEAEREKEARKYLKNREKILKRVSDYQKANPECSRRAGKKYRAANLHLGAAKVMRRRARLMQATPSWAKDEWDEFVVQEIYHLSALRQEATGIKYNVDHAVPLTSELVCGLHCAANLQILTAIDNVKKLNRYWPDMWLEESV